MKDSMIEMTLTICRKILPIPKVRVDIFFVLRVNAM